MFIKSGQHGLCYFKNGGSFLYNIYKLNRMSRLVFLRLFDGNSVEKGRIIGKITSNTRNILSGERTALNFLQRMSGIATLTSKFAEKITDTNTKLLDTRKTTPNLRLLEKCVYHKGTSSVQ